MSNNIDNPAGRLLNILITARGQKDNIPVKQVWANVFGLKADDTGSILFMVAELINLTKNTQEEIQKLEDINHSIYLQPFKKIETAFAVANLETQWSSFKAHITQDTIVALQFCSDTLSRKIGETEIPKEELDALLKDIELLTSSVTQSVFTDDFKAFLIDNLENIRKAILTYRIRGANALKKVFESSIGSICLYQDQIKEENKSKPEQKILSKFFSIVSGLNTLVALALKTKELAGPIAKLLLGPPGE